MEKGYKNIAYFFGIVAMITFIGFYKKYFSLIPEFPGLKIIHHLHAIALTVWLCLLIIQPVLIARKQLLAHKFIGKLSYFLVPLIFASMILVYHNQYQKMLSDGKPEVETNAFIFSPLTDAIPFLIFYMLAILNKKNTASHMRYMMATGIIIGGPGLARIFMTWVGMDFFAAIGLMSLVTLIVFVSLIIYDHVEKRKFRYNPFMIALIIWLIPNILIIFFPKTTLWQVFARWFLTII